MIIELDWFCVVVDRWFLKQNVEKKSKGKFERKINSSKVEVLVWKKKEANNLAFIIMYIM